MMQYIEVDSNGNVLQALGEPEVDSPHVYHPYEGVIDWKRPTPTSVLRWIGGPVWVEMATLSALKDRKIAELSGACGAHIVAGFDSPALGTIHHYPANPTDQMNLTGSITESLMPGLPVDWSTAFWCMDQNGVWEMRAHTAAQIQQVGRDAKAAILAAVVKNEGLRQQVLSAGSMADVQAITWTP